jgi:CYTH domain-containing protein
MEIERKWLLCAMPSLEVYGDYRTVPCSIIEQHYLLIEDDREERVRKAGTHYTHTIKTGNGLVRGEEERDISMQEFNELKQRLVASVTKNRYRIQYGGWILELDEYTDSLAGLVILEVEFKSEEEATAFILPDWATSALEVTTDKCYKNKNLALHGAPSAHPYAI